MQADLQFNLSDIKNVTNFLEYFERALKLQKSTQQLDSFQASIVPIGIFAIYALVILFDLNLFESKNHAAHPILDIFGETGVVIFHLVFLAIIIYYDYSRAKNPPVITSLVRN